MNHPINAGSRLYLAYLSMFYMMIMLCSAILTNKIIIIGQGITLAGSIVVPILFSVSDIIAEIFEYKITSRIIIAAFIGQFIFTITTYILSHLPSPDFWHGQANYNFVLGPLFRLSLASFVAYFASSLVNIYILSKWRHLWNGRFFWIRSIGSSAVGEFLFTVMAVLFIKYGKLPNHILLNTIITSYSIKLIGSSICSLPANAVVLYIKHRLKKTGGYDKSGTIKSPFHIESTS